MKSLLIADRRFLPLLGGRDSPPFLLLLLHTYTHVVRYLPKRLSSAVVPFDVYMRLIHRSNETLRDRFTSDRVHSLWSCSAVTLPLVSPEVFSLLFRSFCTSSPFSGHLIIVSSHSLLLSCGHLMIS